MAAAARMQLYWKRLFEEFLLKSEKFLTQAMKISRISDASKASSLDGKQMKISWEWSQASFLFGLVAKNRLVRLGAKKVVNVEKNSV